MLVNIEKVKRIYVAGPMTGIDDFNFPLFFQVAARLEALGFEVENPANNDGPTLEEALHNSQYASRGSWEEYMKIDIPRVLGCDAICNLPGWRQSKGAQWENDIARRLSMPVLRYDFESESVEPLFEVIGLSGFATVGKDEAARQLVGAGWERRAFADVLRNCLYTLNPMVINEKSIWTLRALINKDGWQSAKIKNAEVRRLLQYLGTEVGRNILGENIWVDTVMKSLEDGHKYVFTDCRFPNEAETVKRYGGKMIKITRPGVGPLNDHPSENSLNDFPFDAYVENDGSLEQLKERLLEIV